ncbi:MAG: DUF4250 domain-containing protein [Eubacterium sp.]|nr:DUF4250 domain-containing protein [Eubacterium sp.]
MSLPKDAAILFGIINMKLRDFYPSLDALCEDLQEDRNEIEQILGEAGFEYDEKANCFK